MEECRATLFDKNEAIKQLNAFEKNSNWYNKNRRELQTKYKDMYIAIKEGKIVEANADIECIYEKLETKGIALNQILIEFIQRDDVIWIL